MVVEYIRDYPAVMAVCGVEPFTALFVHIMGVRIGVDGPVQLHPLLDSIRQVYILFTSDTIGNKVAYSYFIIIKGKVNMG